MSEGKTRSLARITSADIQFVYNDLLGLCVSFEYEGGTGQSLSGYTLDAAMVIRFMAAISVDKLSAAKGKSCWVTHSWSKIHKIEPLHQKDGTPFDVDEWQAWCKDRMGSIGLTYHELLTGERPK